MQKKIKIKSVLFELENKLNIFDNIKIQLKKKQINVYVNKSLFFTQQVIDIKEHVNSSDYWYMYTLFVIYQHGLIKHINKNKKN